MQSQPPIYKKVCVVGCGPVGMFTSLLLEHFNIDYIAVQKNPSIRSPPYSFWLSASSKAVFRQIPQLVQAVQKEDFGDWAKLRNWNFGDSVFGEVFGVTDVFQPSVQHKIKQSQIFFGERPSHILQNKLIKTMYGQLKYKQSILLNKQVTKIQSNYNNLTKRNQFTVISSTPASTSSISSSSHSNMGQKTTIVCDYLILCTGSQCKLRTCLPSSVPAITVQGTPNIISMLYINFTSSKLVEKMKQRNKNVMVYWIMNRKIIGRLIVSTFSGDGEFVLEVVNYQPVVDLTQVYSTQEIISMALGEAEWDIIQDLCILGVAKKQMEAVLASLLYSNGVFLAGGSAHSFPNSGQFNLNVGLQDAHELVHALVMVQRNANADKQKIFNRYSYRRWEVGLRYLKKAVEIWESYKLICKKLGLSLNSVQIFGGNSMLKSMMTSLAEKKPHYMQKLRLKAFSLMFKQRQLQKPLLQLFHDQFQMQTQTASILKPLIMRQNSLKQANQRHQKHEQQKQSSILVSKSASTSTSTSAGSEYSQLKRKNNQCQQQTDGIPVLYARQWSITLEDVLSNVGDIDPKNITFFKCQDPKFRGAERLVLADGTVLIF